MAGYTDDSLLALEDAISVNAAAAERIARDIAGLRRLLYCVLATTGPVAIDRELVRLSRHLTCEIRQTHEISDGEIQLAAGKPRRIDGEELDGDDDYAHDYHQRE